MDSLLNAIERFRSYGRNWDTQNAKEVSHAACDKAVAFLTLMHERFGTSWALSQAFVYPTADGSIGLDLGGGVDILFTEGDAAIMFDEE